MVFWWEKAVLVSVVIGCFVGGTSGCSDVVSDGDPWEVSDPDTGDAGTDTDERPADTSSPIPDAENIVPGDASTPEDQGTDSSPPMDAEPEPDVSPDVTETKTCRVDAAMGGGDLIEWTCRLGQMCVIDEMRNPQCVDTACVDEPQANWCDCVMEELRNLCTERCAQNGTGIRCDFFL